MLDTKYKYRYIYR